MRDGFVMQGPETDPDAEPTRREIGARLPAAEGSSTLTGRTVAHFRIGEPLGSGGMGVVYQAEDLRLGRLVALKFLAPELVRDPAAKERLLTEARAASALEHPNLCTILEVGESEEGLLFLAMPRYDGESLDRRIARGPLAIEEALDIVSQAARGLAKAHQHGIVHRDVKPSNLFVTSDGVVKVMDFGIAKLTGEVGPTRAGAFLGTPSYMAPEQALSETVDAKADVWSLGVVLYELLAGRRPFIGGSGVAVVYAVLHEIPVPLARARPEVPEDLDRILSRMLAKAPEERYTDAAEVLADLRKAQDFQTTGNVSPPSTRRSGRRLTWAALGAAVLVLIGGVASGLLEWRGRGATPALVPGQIVQLTDFEGRETSPSLSPDGTFFVYAKSVNNNFDLFSQRVAGGNPRNLTEDSLSDDLQPAFSPDGQQIAFRSEREGGGIFIMGATGESPRRLTNFGYNPAWSPDGREIAVATERVFAPDKRYAQSEIFRINVATGETRSLGIQDGVQPAWSPQGLRIAFWGVAEPGARRVIWTIPAAGGLPIKVVDDAFYNWSPAWSTDGLLYFASNRGGSMNLWRVALDEFSGRPLGPPQPVTTSSEWSALPSLSRDGRRLVYATDNSRSFVELVPFDSETGWVKGPPTLVYQGARGIHSCDISPDEKWLALWATSPTEDLLLSRADGSELRELTSDLARDQTPSWSPDGSRILFSSNRSGKYEAWMIRPDGSDLTQVTSLPEPVRLAFWAPDGKRIGFRYGARGTALLDLLPSRSRLRELPTAGSGLAFVGLNSSDDGRHVVGVLTQQDGGGGPDGILLWSFAAGTYRRLTRTGSNPMFLHDGKRILFKDTDGIKIVDVGRGDVRTVLAPPPRSWFIRARVGPGDRNLCTVRASDEGDIWSLELVEAE